MFNKVICHLVLFVFVFFVKLILKDIYFGFCFTCFFCHPFFQGVPKHRYAWWSLVFIYRVNVSYRSKEFLNSVSRPIFGNRVLSATCKSPYSFGIGYKKRTDPNKTHSIQHACMRFFWLFQEFCHSGYTGTMLIATLFTICYETRSSKQEQFKNIDRQSTLSQQRSKVQSSNIYYSVIKKRFSFGGILEPMSTYQ